MSRAFFYKERRLTFVVISLASWFGLLGLFGPYLPANASATNRQMIFNMHGNQLTSHWIKKNGRWQFLKISKISKLNRGKQQRAASLQKRPKTNSAQEEPLVAAVKAPRTTASVSSSIQRRVKKKALRAKLANEIGRWAKIGNRWEWRATGKAPQSGQSSKKSGRVRTRRQIDYLEPTQAPYDRQREAHWIERDGRWSFELVDEHTILRNI